MEVDVAVMDSIEMMEYITKRAFLGGQRQSLRHPSNTTTTATSSFDPAEHIRASSFYQIDHSKLPHKSPDQLNKIRVVMVHEKTRMRVSLRYPSIYTLRSYFNENPHSWKDKNKKKLPALDEKFTIGSEVAAEALYRRIPLIEIAEKSNSWSFWVVKKPSVSTQKLDSNPPKNTTLVVSRKGSLISELKGTGMVTWGQRRQVRFLAKHMEDKREIAGVTNDEIKGENEGHEENESDGADDIEEEEEEEEEEEVKVMSKSCEAKRKLRKRKSPSGSSSKSTHKKKKPKSNLKKNQLVVYRPKKNKVVKNSIDRWSAERYKLAEVNMLKVMKEQNAVFGNPILRPELRAEARKLIGDTGLLDHLLKHMAGKVAPGGEDRFRRRHNADGAMEYWLEKANLLEIRKQAGVQDPYWTPPPGWKLGDNPTQDPVCAGEIKQLREEIAKIKKDMEEMVSKKHGKELAIVAEPNSSTIQNLEHDNLLIPLKEMYIDLVNKKAKMEEQLMEISESLCGMEEEMEKLKTTMEESNRSESTERPALMGSIESGKLAGIGRKRGELMPQEREAMVSGELPQDSSTEDKATKIERLRSGFRICKPQGSFLWPNMTTSSSHPQVPVPLEDLIAAHTPPSVTSSTSPKQQPHHLLLAPPSQTHEPHPTSPVKPLAEKRLVTIPQSTAVTTPIPCCPLDPITPTTTKTKTPLINLNEPLNPHQTDDITGLSCGSQSHAQTSSYPVTYQRRQHQNVTTTVSMPSLGLAKNDMISHQRKCTTTMSCEQQQQQQTGCSSASSIASSSLSMGVGSTWLSLATSNPSMARKSTTTRG